MADVRVGAFPPGALVRAGADGAPEILGQVAGLGIDHLCVGDHVSFRVGAGTDGLISAAALLAAQTRLPVYVALYLLPLRHPVPVARQLATVAQIAPGRLTLGVGIGGEDRHEVEICGVDPRTRGRRMDECMEILGGLLGGRPLTYEGEFFSLDEALIVPPPSPPIPLVVGGRSAAAVRRAGRLGDGWLAIWVSPRRFRAAVGEIAAVAAGAGRDPEAQQHALNVWCGFDADRGTARRALATAMEAFYQLPFESFERYSPYGTPAAVAEQLAAYVDAGCGTFNVIPCADSAEDALAAVAEVRALLNA